MVSDWLRRLFGRTPDAAPAPLAPRPVQASPELKTNTPAKTPKLAIAVQAAPAEPPQPANELAEDVLRNRLSTAIRELDGQTTGAERTPAFLTLLGQLTANPEGRLRRPPTAAQRAMTACRREDVGIDALVELLERDPSLTQAILARANSAYYSRGGGPCLMLPDAILRQGRQSVHSVLLEQTIGSLIYTGTEQWRRMIDQIWSHMVRTAPIARGLAPAFDVEPEQAFALALLHDVGKLAIFDRMASLRTAQRSEFVLDPVTISRTLRLLHEPLGGLCAMGWQFGGEAALAIASHHRRPLPEKPDALTEVLWLAERVDIASVHQEPIDLEQLWLEGGLSGHPAPVALLLPELVPPAANATV